MNLFFGTIQTFIVHILIFIQGLIIIPLIVKTSDIETYGYYSLLVSFFGVIYGISSWGYGYNAMRYLPKTQNNKERSELFFNQFYFQLISISFLSIILLLIISYAQKKDLLSIGGLSIFLIPIYLAAQVLYGQSTIYLRFTNKINFMNIVTGINPYLFITIILLIYYYFEELTLNFIFFSNTISMIIIGSIVFFLLRKELNFSSSIPSLASVKEDMMLGIPLALSFLVETMIIIGDRYIIAFFLNTKEVGSYTSAYTIGCMSILLAKVFNIIIPPFISKKIDFGDKDTCINVLNISLKVYLLISIPFAFGSVIFAKEILLLITDEETSNLAWVVVPIISFATIFFGINIILSCILFVKKNTKILFKVNLVIAIFNLTLNFILVGIFRIIEVAALSTFLSHILGTILIKKYLDPEWTEKVKIDFIAYLIIFSLGMFIAIILMKSFLTLNYLFFNIFFGVFFGVIQYFFLLILFRNLFIVEFNLIKKFFFEKNKHV